jgi:two-component system, OmpR family, sensor histidine kinase KdpD
VALARRDRAAGARTVAFVLAVFAVTTAAVALVEGLGGGQLDGAPVYLVAVVVVASRYRTAGGVVSAVVAFLIYNLLFTDPRFTLVVSDPREWLNLVLFLFVAVVIGRLAGIGADRTTEAETRVREAAALYAITRTLATEGPETALPSVMRRLVVDAGMTRAWCTMETAGRPQRIADSGSGEPGVTPTAVQTLLMDRGQPAWVRTHDGRIAHERRDAGDRWFRIRLDAEGGSVGTLWATRPAGAPDPDRAETRLLTLAAGQVGQAIGRERLRDQALVAEIARRDAALKSALVDSVSHDLRTPLAGIRAAAGTLADDSRDRTPAEVRSTASLIEAETQRLDRMVGGLLDLSRIQAGAIHPSRDALDVEDAVLAVVERLRPILGPRHVVVDVPADLPPVAGDAVFVDQCLANLVENTARHAPEDATLTVRARLVPGTVTDAAVGSLVELAFEDDGPGVDPEVAGRMFDRFYRGDARVRSGGMGIGLTIVRGLTEAMGGSVEAVLGEPSGRDLRRALTVRLRLPAMPLPAIEMTDAAEVMDLGEAASR